MSDPILIRLFEHNNWANAQIIRACAALADAQLDAEPHTATKGTIRATLWHLVDSQDDYLATLTGTEPRFAWPAPPSFAELEEGARVSGEGFVALARDPSAASLGALIHKEDGYTIEPWVVMVQAINHATEHREQIKSMLTALGITPPRIDGWGYGRVTHALIPPG